MQHPSCCLIGPLLSFGSTSSLARRVQGQAKCLIQSIASMSRKKLEPFRIDGHRSKHLANRTDNYDFPNSHGCRHCASTSTIQRITSTLSWIISRISCFRWTHDSVTMQYAALGLRHVFSLLYVNVMSCIVPQLRHSKALQSAAMVVAQSCNGHWQAYARTSNLNSSDAGLILTTMHYKVLTRPVADTM